MAAKSLDIDHRYDRRDTDTMYKDEKQTLYCITCRKYHRVQMQDPKNGVIETLSDERP